MSISKEKSHELKGIAILMMVFSHLFMNIETSEVWGSMWEAKILYFLSLSSGPVPIFMMLSGYGLALTFERRGGNIRNKEKIAKIIRLYSYHWFVLALFVPLLILQKKITPPGLDELIFSIAGFDVSLNSVMWFLLPYSIIYFFSGQIIREVNIIGIIVSLIVSVIIYLGALFAFSQNILPFSPLWRNNIIHLTTLFLYFIVGVSFYKTKPHNEVNMSITISYICIGALVILMGVTNGNNLFSVLYYPALLFLLVHIKWPLQISVFLIELGEKSIWIWMIHMLLFNLLKDLMIEYIRYPILVYITLIMISYFLSILMNEIFKILNYRTYNIFQK